MKRDLWQRYQQLLRAGLTVRQQETILRELRHDGEHQVPAPSTPVPAIPRTFMHGRTWQHCRKFPMPAAAT